MEFFTLASSSSGNCSVLRTETECFLIDAGISCRRIETALREKGLSLASLSAIFITHEHTDHIGGLATLLKKCSAPIYASRGTAGALRNTLAAAPGRICAFPCGDEMEFSSCRVRSFAISHDTDDPTGYRFDAPDGSLGVLTDTGFVTDEARQALLGVDTLLLESNHDVGMVENGPYPYHLKRRILGDRGHLSNAAAAAFALECVKCGTQDILLAHLSAENNTPSVAEYTVARALQKGGHSVRLSVAPRETTSEVHLCRKSRSFV
ncbi:MAG: MBL fold metallo-hydrolase [Oscillospiraceae bacterium]|nr:MBL fold metallo-hydrolase [Oscillospiraceae bacterium]